MEIQALRRLFEILNCKDVQYQFYTKWFMEITLNLLDKTIQFAVKESDGEYVLYVLEPSGYANLGKVLLDDDILNDDTLICLISKYLTQLASFLAKDNQFVYLKQTDVVENRHTTTYLSSFLDTLHACGYINTYWREFTQDGIKKVYVFIIDKEN